jgi:hypothetical protein
MNFINNYAVPVQLAEGATTLAVPGLPDGYYTLTLSDARGAAATRWEYLGAWVAAGTASLLRGAEGSEDQDWPAGSWLYCSITAGVMADLYSQIQSLAEFAGELSARLAALEPPPPQTFTVTVGLSGSNAAGYSQFFGAVSPAALELPGLGQMPLDSLAFYASPSRMTVIFLGNFDPALIASIAVEGAGVYPVSEASLATNEEDGPVTYTVYQWPVTATDWFAASGQERSVAITLA